MREKFLQLSWASRAPELYSRLMDIASEKDVFGLFVETAGRCAPAAAIRTSTSVGSNSSTQ